MRGTSVAPDDRRLAVARDRAVAAAVHATFQRSGRARRRHTGRSTNARRGGHDYAAALDGPRAHHALADRIGKLRVATEERSHIRRGPGTFSAGTTTDTAAEDVAHRRVRISDFISGETRGRAADQARVAVAAQPVADQVRGQGSLIDVTIHELIGSDEGPRTKIDFAGTNAARPSPSAVKSGAGIWPVGPVVVRAIAVVPTHRSPADVARAEHPVNPGRRV